MYISWLHYLERHLAGQRLEIDLFKGDKFQRDDVHSEKGFVTAPL